MRVEQVKIAGRVIVNHGTTTLVDEHEVRAKAREAAARLHQRMENL